MYRKMEVGSQLNNILFYQTKRDGRIKTLIIHYLEDREGERPWELSFV